jgi:hypothetical protein
MYFLTALPTHRSFVAPQIVHEHRLSREWTHRGISRICHSRGESRGTSLEVFDERRPQDNTEDNFWNTVNPVGIAEIRTPKDNQMHKLEESLNDISESILCKRAMGTPLSEGQNRELLDFVEQILKLNSGVWTENRELEKRAGV